MKANPTVRLGGALSCVLSGPALWVVVIAEIGKRLDVRTVNGFVALFVPTGVLPCTINPLVQVALYLITGGKIVSIQIS
jgi:hypothetical protein